MTETTEKTTDLEAVRRCVRLRLADLELGASEIADGLGVSRQAVHKRLAKTSDVGWLAFVCGIPEAVLATGDFVAVLSYPRPAEGWLSEGV